MRRVWQTWTVFAAFLAVVIIAMAWISYTVLRLEGENLEAQRLAGVEESVRLALWRMDAAISPLILEESARPYFDYWTALDNKAQEQDRDSRGTTSPAQIEAAPDVNLYFNAIVTQGRTNPAPTSPQVAAAEQQWNQTKQGKDFEVMNKNKAQLQVFNSNVSVAQLQQVLDQAKLGEEAVNQSPGAGNAVPPIPSALTNNVVRYAPQQQPGYSPLQQESPSGWGEYSQRQGQSVQTRNRLAASKRKLYDSGNPAQMAKDEADRVRQDEATSSAETPAAGKGGKGKGAAARPAAPLSLIKEDVMRPVWAGNFLLLARRVNVNGEDVIQGVWLNWESIKSNLLNNVADLFPRATLVPADPVREPSKAHLLGYLPVRFVPGMPAGLPAVSGSPLRLPLAVAWVFVAVAALAVAALLFGTTSLSERRAAFVSAVTHELRTPLTTFRMYTEMLSENMIRDEDRKKQYLETLCKESNRLGHLVENVLAYARLERGAGGRLLEPVSAGAILDRAIDPLARRAKEAGMELVMDVSDENRAIQSRTDLMAVEQILFNLVDNACKYAASALDRRIHLAVTSTRRHLVFRVCDHGPGLKRHEQRTAFKPFRKSAEKAAQTAPGVGLGLALCKSLTRQLGGDVLYEEHTGYGACFTVNLPRC